MADSPYRLMAQLDGARLVKFDSDGLLYAWFGGHGVHAYDAQGNEVDYWNCGDFADNDASTREVEESIARRILNLDSILEQAEEEGYERGVSAGSWVVDGNTTKETARRLLQGIEEGDPEVMDTLPSSPLSGEWADGLTPSDLLDSFGLDEEHDAASDVLDAFELGYSRGVEAEVVRSCQAIFGSEARSR